MQTSNLAIIALVAYLLGSIPFGYILVRIFTGADVRAQGSGNIGATNVARTGKKGLAIATLALDAAKGWAAVLIGMQLAEQYFRNSYLGISLDRLPYIARETMLAASLAALMAVVGHMFPVWLKFKGGKGVATGLGVFVALAPKALIASMLVFLLVVGITRYVSLGSILASAAFPFNFWYLMHGDISPAAFAMVCAVPLLIIFKHKENIQRLMAGTESKFGASKKENQA